MKHFFRTLLMLLCSLPLCAADDRPDLLLADFEGDTYGAWKVEGTAFGTGPARGTLPNQMPVAGFKGKGLANSYHGGDGSTGKLTSPSFTIERRYLQFLIGGGKFPGKTCINLLLDGKSVRTATGPNDKPGGSEHLDWQQWDVGEFAGKSVGIEIVDEATGGWGHICVDHIIQTDRRLPGILTDAKREFVAEKRYLNLPVKHGGPKRRLSVLLDGHAVRDFEIELADATPDFWVFLDLTPFQGKNLTVQVDRLPEDSTGLKNVEQSDALRGAENLYHEKLRPQFHFSSRRGWNNDPNGMVFYKGEYHLFYQHNPYGWDWGNMHWGHAVSKDLVHWTELPIALYPRQFGDWCFSGSAVVDRRNTAGFKTGAEDVIVAAYTSTGRGECIVYSNDRGRTFAEFAGNPVVKHQGRDPKLIWHEPTKRWVMAVYDEVGKTQNIAFYTSPDLKKWDFQSRIEGYFECPEIFELPVDADPKNTRWVLYAADGNYAVGRFDGKTFTPETKKLRGNYGNCFYASQTFSDVPDGRRIQIGWGRIATPGMPFNQMMTFPCELTLRTAADGPRLFTNPVKEIATLHHKRHVWQNVVLKAGENPLADLRGELFHVRAEFAVGAAATSFGLTVRGVPIIYDVKKQTLACTESAPLAPVDGKIRLDVLVDRTSVEIFANSGLVYIPYGKILNEKERSLTVSGTGGVTLTHLEVNDLNAAWQNDER
jgi:fructan beta-fructosidase